MYTCTLFLKVWFSLNAHKIAFFNGPPGDVVKLTILYCRHGYTYNLNTCDTDVFISISICLGYKHLVMMMYHLKIQQS